MNHGKMSKENLEFEIVLSSQAKKALIKADRKTQQRLVAAIEGLKQYPPIGDIVPLAGRPGQKRCRVGNWRIIFRQDATTFRTEIAAILPRGEAYKKIIIKLLTRKGACCKIASG